MARCSGRRIGREHWGRRLGRCHAVGPCRVNVVPPMHRLPVDRTALRRVRRDAGGSRADSRELGRRDPLEPDVGARRPGDRGIARPPALANPAGPLEFGEPRPRHVTRVGCLHGGEERSDADRQLARPAPRGKTFDPTWVPTQRRKGSG